MPTDSMALVSSAVRLEVGGLCRDGLGTAALGDEDNRPALGIGRQGR